MKIHYKQPPVFDSSTGSYFFKWFDQIQGLHQLYKYNNKEYLHVIVSTLSRAAAHWLLLQPNETQLSPQVLLMALKRTYGHYNDGVLAHQVSNCHQNTEEQCQCYWQQLLMESHHGRTSSHATGVLQQLWCEGLHPELQQYVVIFPHLPFDDLLTQAELYEVQQHQLVVATVVVVGWGKPGPTNDEWLDKLVGAVAELQELKECFEVSPTAAPLGA
jgi:hypothetical protein